MLSAPSTYFNTQAFWASRLLWLLALITLVVGRVFFASAPCLTFAQAYTIPLKKPMMIAETLPKVTGAWKKIKPDTATGSLLSAPVMEYVVEEVTRMHQADA